MKKLIFKYSETSINPTGQHSLTEFLLDTTLEKKLKSTSVIKENQARKIYSVSLLVDFSCAVFFFLIPH